jgi:hypothetical protein
VPSNAGIPGTDRRMFDRKAAAHVKAGEPWSADGGKHAGK